MTMCALRKQYSKTQLKHMIKKILKEKSYHYPHQIV